MSKVLIVILLTLALTSLPYLLGYLLAPPDMEFGGLVMNIEDSQSYLAKMLQGWQGRSTYQIPFTPEEHEGAFVGGFYLFWGWMARWLGIPIIHLWHLSRLGCGALLLFAIYLFIARFLEDAGQRLYAFLLASLGSGLGWLALLAGGPFFLGSFPPDFKMPESHPFFTILTFPHFSFATAMLIFTFICALEHLHSGHLWLSLLAGLLTLLIIIAQPFNAAIVAAVIFAYLVSLAARRKMVWRRLLGLSPLALIPLPLVVYYYRLFTVNPAFRSWYQQAVTPSPHPLHYLLAYLPLLLPAIPGALYLWRQKEPQTLLLIVWPIIVFPLLYLPVNPQRRFVEGVHIPLSILATLGIYNSFLPWIEGSSLWARITSLPRYRPGALRHLLLASFLLLTLPSNLYILASLGVTALQHPYPFFHEQAEVEAVDWLAANTSREDTIFTTYWTGSYIPARAGNRVFLGHWAETQDYAQKLEEAKIFFATDTPDDWRIHLLRAYNISYLFYGPRERALQGFIPEGKPYLEEAYVNSLVAIYRVVTEGK